MSLNLVFALLLPFQALILQWMLWPWISPYVWTLFYPCVFFSARLDGLRGGILSTFISLPMVWYFFMPPQLSWSLDPPSNFYSLGIFLFMGCMISGTHERLRRSNQQSKTEIINQSEAKFAAVFEQAAVGIALVSLEGKWLRANQKLCHIVGYSHEELISTTFQEITYPDDLDTDLSYVRQVLAGEITTYTLEKRYLRKQGDIVWINLTVSFSKKADGSPDYFIAVIEDIQQRKLTELALKQNQADLAEAQHIAKIGSWLCDFTGLITWSDEAYRIYGVERNTFIPTKDAFLNLLHPDDREPMQLWIQACAAGLRSDDIIYRRIFPDGHVKFLLAKGELKRDADLNPVCISGTLQDITQLKQAELGLRESEEKFRCAFANAAIGFAITTIEGYFTNVNAAYCIITGYSLDELRNIPYTKIIHADDLQSNIVQVNRLFADEIQGFVVENRYFHKSGRAVWVRKSISLVRDSNNVPQWLIALVEDITERKSIELDLQLAKERLQLAMDATRDGIWDWNLQTGEVFRSPRYYEIVGKRPEQDQGDFEFFKSTVFPEDFPHALAAIDAHKQGNSPNIEFDYRLANFFEKPKWVMARGKAVARDAHGNALRIVGTLMDISDRKDAENALRESQQRLQLILDASRDGIWDWDLRTNSIYRSPRYYEMIGLEPEAGKSGTEFTKLIVHPDDLAYTQEAIEAHVQGKSDLLEVDFRLANDTQKTTWLMSKGRAVERDANGIALRIVGALIDITERKLAEKAILDSKLQLEAALASMSDAVFISDAQGRFIHFNEAFVTYHKFNNINECAKTFTEYPELLDVFMADGSFLSIDQWAVPRALRGEAMINAEYTLRRKDTGETWIGSYNFAPIRNADSTIVGAVVTARDITVSKHIEDEIRQLNASLEQRVQQRTAELTSANHELDAFAYAVSHDLRAPLRAMSGFSTALLEDYSHVLNSEATMYLEQINLASNKMSELINGLLVLSRSVRGELQLNDIDLSSLAIRLFNTLSKNQLIGQITFEVEPSLQIRGDIRMIEVVISNLLENALKYTSKTASPSIRVYAEHRDGKRYYCVADNGAGFDMVYASHLFKPFQRLHRQDEFPGIRIGLATVQRIIHRHGGTIEASGEVGKGAVFSFSLGYDNN